MPKSMLALKNLGKIATSLTSGDLILIGIDPAGIFDDRVIESQNLLGALEDLLTSETTLADGDYVRVLKDVAGTLTPYTMTKVQFIGALGIHASINLFLENTASDLAGYKSLAIDVPSGGSVNDSASIAAADTVVNEYASIANLFTFISAQVATIHLHLAKTAGSKSVNAYVKVFHRTSGGVETLLGTSSTISTIAGAETEYNFGVSLPDTVFSATDRFVLKLYGTPGGAGTDPTLAVYFQGTSNSRVSFSGTRVNSSSSGSGGGDVIRTKYIITPSISANNLVFAIKYIDGNDCTASNKLTFRVGNTEYDLTAALSFTKNAGTNWCNLGGDECKTLPHDLFVYAIGETGASAGLKFGYSRVPYARTMGDFVNTTTSEKYIAGNWTNFNSTDPVTVIGRFRAQLSAGAGYTWSIPTAVVVNHPIWSTDWLSWTPTLVGWAATPTVVASHYVIEGRTMTIKLIVQGTSDNTVASATLPLKSKNLTNFWQYGPAGYYQDNGTAGSGGVTEVQANTALMSFYKTGYAAWTSSGTKSVYTTSNIELE